MLCAAVADQRRNEAPGRPLVECRVELGSDANDNRSVSDIHATPLNDEESPKRVARRESPSAGKSGFHLWPASVVRKTTTGRGSVGLHEGPAQLDYPHRRVPKDRNPEVINRVCELVGRARVHISPRTAAVNVRYKVRPRSCGIAVPCGPHSFALAAQPVVAR